MSPDPGSAEMLAFLKDRGIRMAVISNMSFRPEVLQYELEQHGLHHCFEVVISSADYGIRKPSRFLFDVALRRLNVSAADTWYVGDTFQDDVIGAAKAGLTPVRYNRKKADCPDSGLRCHEIHDWGQLVIILNQRPLAEGRSGA